MEAAAGRSTTEAGEQHLAPILVNAAGSWADAVAALAGVRRSACGRCGGRSSPSTRPTGPDRLPAFTKTVGDELYFAPESPAPVRLTDGRSAGPPLRRPAGRI